MLESKMLSQVQLLVPATEPNHIVRKEDMDKAIEGLRWDPVKAASTGNIAGAATAAALTGAANGALPSLDGVAIGEGDRVLLWQQSDKSQNGLYVLSQQGDASKPWILTRSTDADAGDEFRPNKAVYVMPDGALYGDTSFKQTTGTSVTLGTTPIEFALATSDSVNAEAFDIVGDGSKTEFTINHTLGTRDVLVQIRDAQGMNCYFTVQVISTASVKIASGVALGAGETYRVVITGKAD